MPNREFQRAVRYGESAMELLREKVIPPYPQFYELIYTYVTGVNPHLNNKMDGIFGDGKDGDLAERLYNEFLRTNDVEERLNSVSEKIFSKIESVRGAVHTAIDSADKYTGSLVRAKDSLTEEIDREALRTLTEELVQETRKMQVNNRALEDQLEASKADIAALQRDLDEVRRESQLDPLTKLYNRKFFDRGLDRAVTEAQKSGQPMSLILFDIDHFKRFNDDYGHQTGDQVLRLVALTLKSSIKGKDIGARYGGEEFAAVLPNTDLNGGNALAEIIRKAIQAKELLRRSTNEKLGRVTASFGVAVCSPEDTPVSLVERADRCLYVAKKAGRNRVIDEDSPLFHQAHSAA